MAPCISPDAADSVVEDYPEAAMLWAVQSGGIIGGYPNGTLDPASLATRTQVAYMMTCYCAQLA